MDATVIVAAFNEQRCLCDQLSALSRQVFDGDFEVLVCDNGSTDRTPEIVREWAKRDPRFRLIPATKFGRGAGQARNMGARFARSDYLVFCDADDVVDAHWLRHLVEGLHHYAVVNGRADTRLLNPKWTRIARPVAEGIHHDAALPALSAGNCGMRAAVFDQVGGYDPEVTYLEDLDISWRLQFAGYEISYVPDALLHVRLRRTVKGIFGQGYSYGRGLKILQERHRDRLPTQRRHDGKSRTQGRVDTVTALLRAFAASPFLGGWGFLVWQVGWVVGHRSHTTAGS